MLPFYTDDFLINRLRITDPVALAAWGDLKQFLIREENKEWQDGVGGAPARRVHNPEKAFRLVARAMGEINRFTSEQLFPNEKNAIEHKWNLQLILYFQMMALADDSPNYDLWDFKTKAAKRQAEYIYPKFVRRKEIIKKRERWKHAAGIFFTCGFIAVAVTAPTTMSSDISSPSDRSLIPVYSLTSAVLLITVYMIRKCCQKEDELIDLTDEMIADINAIYRNSLPEVHIEDLEKDRQRVDAIKKAIGGARTEPNEVKDEKQSPDVTEGIPEDKKPAEKFCCINCILPETETEQHGTESNLFFLQIDQKADGKPIGFYGPFHHTCATQWGVAEPIAKRPIPFGIEIQTQPNARFRWLPTLPTMIPLQRFVNWHSAILKKEEDERLQKEKEQLEQELRQQQRQESDSLAPPDPNTDVPFDQGPFDRWYNDLEGKEGESRSNVESKQGAQQRAEGVSEESKSESFARRRHVMSPEDLQKRFGEVRAEGEEEGVDFLEGLSRALHYALSRINPPKDESKREEKGEQVAHEMDEVQMGEFFAAFDEAMGEDGDHATMTSASREMSASAPSLSLPHSVERPSSASVPARRELASLSIEGLSSGSREMKDGKEPESAVSASVLTHRVNPERVSGLSPIGLPQDVLSAVSAHIEGREPPAQHNRLASAASAALDAPVEGAQRAEGEPQQQPDHVISVSLSST